MPLLFLNAVYLHSSKLCGSGMESPKCCSFWWLSLVSNLFYPSERFSLFDLKEHFHTSLSRSICLVCNVPSLFSTPCVLSIFEMKQQLVLLNPSLWLVKVASTTGHLWITNKVECTQTCLLSAFLSSCFFFFYCFSLDWISFFAPLPIVVQKL